VEWYAVQWYAAEWYPVEWYGLQWYWWLPAAAFALLLLGERRAGHTSPHARYGAADWVLNLTGLFMQGVVVPLAAIWISVSLLPEIFPGARASLKLGSLGSFLLNFVVVDFLYYWQHRWFHRWRPLWQLHLCHHASPALDVWASSRNSLPVNFLFVYLLLSPLLGYLCDTPEAFFFGAALTASLDLWRHSRLPAGREGMLARAVGWLLVTPCNHHLHHTPADAQSNFGANLMLWDRLFGTARDATALPQCYGIENAPGALRQLLFPWPQRSGAAASG